jgi:small-conductance mechanosensitive channel/CRP-like cAMP-binding protein
MIADVLGTLGPHLGLSLLLTLLLLPFRRWPGWRRALGWVWLAIGLHWLVINFNQVMAPALGDLFGVSGSTADVLPKVAPAAVRLVAIWAALKVAEVVVWQSFIRRRGRPLPRLLWDLVAVAVMIVAVLRVLSVDFGVDLQPILVTSTVISVVVGLALQDTLRNLIAGIALQLDPPFSIGEWVTLGEHEGEVVEFNWRTLAIRTRENNIVVLPNGTVASTEIINYGRPDLVSAFDVFVGVAYGHPPGEVKPVLAEAVRGAEGVSTRREPGIFVHEFQDFAVLYRMRVWIEDWSRKPQVKDAVLRRVWYQLRRAGFGIPFPIRDVNLRTVPEDAPLLERLDREETMRDGLRPLSLLASLRDDQIADLASASRLARFTAGEALFHQGEPGDSLYVLLSGGVRVDVTDGDGTPVVTVAHRGGGDFIGEMSLLTGEPRSATLVAEAETDAVIVPAGAVAQILAEDPEVLHNLSAALAERVLERDVQLAEVANRAEAQASLKAQLLERMRRFFGV